MLLRGTQLPIAISMRLIHSRGNANGPTLTNTSYSAPCSQQLGISFLRAIRKAFFSHWTPAQEKNSGVFKPEQAIEVPQSRTQLVDGSSLQLRPGGRPSET